MTRARHDQRIAALLAEYLEKDDWARIPEPGVGLLDAAPKAVELYRQIEPLSHAALTGGDEATPIGYAAAALGEIADGYALQSIAWEGHAREILPVPSRLAVESFLHAGGADRWSASLGHPLRLRPEHAQPDESRVVPDAVDDGAALDLNAVATTFGETLAAYTKLLVLFEHEEGRETLRSQRWRERASRQVASSRSWSVWVRERLGLVAPFAALAVAMFDIGRGSFLLTWDSARASPFATRPYLRDLLRKEHADRWLASHGADVPNWLHHAADA